MYLPRHLCISTQDCVYVCTYICIGIKVYSQSYTSCIVLILALDAVSKLY